MSKIWLKLKKLNKSRNNKTRQLKLKLVGNLYKFFIKNKELPPPFFFNNIKNVLIFMFHAGLGDAVINSGFIYELRKNGIKVYVVAEKRINFLFHNGAIEVDGVFDYQTKRFYADIKKHHFDVVIDFNNNRSLFYRRLQTLIALRYKCSISFNNPLDVFDINIVHDNHQHISCRAIKALSLFSLNTDNYQYQLHIPTPIRQEVDDFIAHKLGNKKVIVFNPFATDEHRSMSNTQIYELCDFLEGLENCKTIVCDVTNKLNLSRYKNVILCPFASFINVMAVVKSSALVVTVDTSIVHVASAFNKKQIAIYNNKFVDNVCSNQVWGPKLQNSKLATVISTEDFLKIEQGDPVANLDGQIIIAEIKKLALLGLFNVNKF